MQIGLLSSTIVRATGSVGAHETIGKAMVGSLGLLGVCRSGSDALAVRLAGETTFGWESFRGPQVGVDGGVACYPGLCNREAEARMSLAKGKLRAMQAGLDGLCCGS